MAITHFPRALGQTTEPDIPRQPPPMALADVILDRPLALAQFLLDGVEAFAQQLAWSELGDIDLPPLIQPAADVSYIQSLAPLYLAAELELARLIPAAEILAGVLASGGLRLVEESAISTLYRFWQGRHQRFSVQEREAIFARLFGHHAQTPLAVSGSSNRDFEALMLALAEAIVASEPDPRFGSSPLTETTLQMAAARLLANLLPRSGGITAFAARDIVRTVQATLEIFKDQTVQRALGAISVWTAVQVVARLYLKEEIEVAPYVQRGRSGLLILTWLASVVPRLDHTTERLIPPGHPVVAAAVAWLQATLTPQEAAAPFSP